MEKMTLFQPEKPVETGFWGRLFPPFGKLGERYAALFDHYGKLGEVYISLLSEIDVTTEKYNTLLHRFGLVSAALSAKVSYGKRFVAFNEVLKERFLPFIQTLEVYDNEIDAVIRLNEVASQLHLIESFDRFEKKTLVVVSGGFSSGKSSFINSLLNAHVQLPVGVQPITAIPTYVIHSEKARITGRNKHGGEFDIAEEVYAQLSHEFVARFGFRLRDLLPFIVLEVPLEKYPHLAFIDLPGYNPGSRAGATEQDESSASELVSRAQYLLWVIGLDSNGTIAESDIDFLRSHLPEGARVYIILNKADLKPLSDIEDIMRNVSETLLMEGIAFDGISAYNSRKHEEVAFEGKSLWDILGEWNCPRNAYLPLLYEVNAIFSSYDELLTEDIQARERQRSQLKTMKLDLAELGAFDEEGGPSGSWSASQVERRQDRILAVKQRIGDMTVFLDTKKYQENLAQMKAIWQALAEVLHPAWPDIPDAEKRHITENVAAEAETAQSAAGDDLPLSDAGLEGEEEPGVLQEGRENLIAFLKQHVPREAVIPVGAPDAVKAAEEEEAKEEAILAACAEEAVMETALQEDKVFAVSQADKPVKSKIWLSSKFVLIFLGCLVFILAVTAFFLFRNKDGSKQADSTEVPAYSQKEQSTDAALPNLSKNEQADMEDNTSPVNDKVGVVRAGVLSVNNDDPNAISLQLDGKNIYSNTMAYSLAIEKIFYFDKKEVALVGINSGGTACPMTYVLISLFHNGRVVVSDEFGTCSDIPEIAQKADEIVITMPEKSGKKIVYVYQGETVREVSALPLPDASTKEISTEQPDMEDKSDASARRQNKLKDKESMSDQQKGRMIEQKTKQKDMKDKSDVSAKQQNKLKDKESVPDQQKDRTVEQKTKQNDTANNTHVPHSGNKKERVFEKIFKLLPKGEQKEDDSWKN